MAENETQTEETPVEPEIAAAAETPVEPDIAAVVPEKPAASGAAETPAQPAQVAATEPESTDHSEDTPGERVVPEASTYALPEGAPEWLGEFAHTNGFTQEQLDVTLNTFSGVIQNQKQAEAQALKTEGTEFLDSLGEKKDEAISLARQALGVTDEGKELKTLLIETGQDMNPAVLRYLISIGRVFSEGGFLPGNTNTPVHKNKLPRAHRMYPNDVPQTQ